MLCSFSSTRDLPRRARIRRRTRSPTPTERSTWPRTMTPRCETWSPRWARCPWPSASTPTSSPTVAVNKIPPFILYFRLCFSSVGVSCIGVYYDSPCSSPNHAVTLVGYGVDSNGFNVWYVRNSWGTGWGQSGYMTMYSGYNLFTNPTYPIV
jgi:hypothetical protein